MAASGRRRRHPAQCERFTAALESRHTLRDFFGGPEYRFSRDDLLGNRRGRIAQIRDGRWVILTDYLK